MIIAIAVGCSAPLKADAIPNGGDDRRVHRARRAVISKHNPGLGPRIGALELEHLRHHGTITGNTFAGKIKLVRVIPDIRATSGNRPAPVGVSGRARHARRTDVRIAPPLWQRPPGRRCNGQK